MRQKCLTAREIFRTHIGLIRTYSVTSDFKVFDFAVFRAPPFKVWHKPGLFRPADLNSLKRKELETLAREAGIKRKELGVPEDPGVRAVSNSVSQRPYVCPSRKVSTQNCVCVCVWKRRKETS